MLSGERFKLGPVTVHPVGPRLAPGVLEVAKDAAYVGTGTQPVRLGDVRPFGRRQMPAADWARGARVESGTSFG
jgi:methionyl-tRNA formyltransferase